MKTLGKILVGSAAVAGAYLLYVNFIKKPVSEDFDDLQDAEFEGDGECEDICFAERLKRAAEKQISKLK